MVLNISAVLLFGAASVFAVKTKSTGGAALVLFPFGFFAAGTGAYEPTAVLLIERGWPPHKGLRRVR
jgi:hypothetical protein